MSGCEEFDEVWSRPSLGVGVDELRRKVFLRRSRKGMMLEVRRWAPDGADGTQWMGDMYERAAKVDRMNPETPGLHARFIRAV